MFVQAESSKNKNNKRGKSEKLPPFELSNSIHMLAQEASFCLYLFLSSNLFLCQEASFWPLWLLCQRRLRLRMRMCVCGLLAAGTRTGTPMCTPIYFFFTLLTYTNTPIYTAKKHCKIAHVSFSTLGMLLAFSFAHNLPPIISLDFPLAVLLNLFTFERIFDTICTFPTTALCL